MNEKVPTLTEKAPHPSLTRRAVGVVVLLVAGYVLLHILFHVVVAIAGTILVVAALVALVWALRTVF